MTSAIRAAVVIAGRPAAAPEFITPNLAASSLDLTEGMDGVALDGHAELVDERSQRHPLVVDRGVVALHHGELAHRPARAPASSSLCSQSRSVPSG